MHGFILVWSTREVQYGCALMEVLHGRLGALLAAHPLGHRLSSPAHLWRTECVKRLQQVFRAEPPDRHRPGPDAGTVAAIPPERLVSKERHLQPIALERFSLGPVL